MTVRWDANDRVEPPEPSETEGCKLLPFKWNKDDVGAWRMDLDPPPLLWSHYQSELIVCTVLCAPMLGRDGA